MTKLLLEPRPHTDRRAGGPKGQAVAPAGPGPGLPAWVGFSLMRRRVQNETLGHRGRKADPLYRIRKLLLSADERLDEAGHHRMLLGLPAGDPADEGAGGMAGRGVGEGRLSRRRPGGGGAVVGQDHRRMRPRHEIVSLGVTVGALSVHRHLVESHQQRVRRGPFTLGRLLRQCCPVAPACAAAGRQLHPCRPTRRMAD